MRKYNGAEIRKAYLFVKFGETSSRDCLTFLTDTKVYCEGMMTDWPFYWRHNVPLVILDRHPITKDDFFSMRWILP